MRISEAWNKRVVAAVRTWGSAKERLASASSARERRVHSAPRFSDLSSYKYIRRIEQIGRTLGLKSPFFRPNERRVGSRTFVAGRSRLNFAWCNYLGLNEHPAVAEAARSAIEQHGTCVSASRMVAGEIPLHQMLEDKIARFCGVRRVRCSSADIAPMFPTLAQSWARKTRPSMLRYSTNVQTLPSGVWARRP